MTITIDYSTEYTYWDNTEAVTLERVVAGGVTQSQSIAIAARANIRRSSSTVGGVLLQGDEVEWWLPCALVDTIGTESASQVNRGDTIIDSNNERWVILSAVMQRLGSVRLHWACLCSRQEQ